MNPLRISGLLLVFFLPYLGVRAQAPIDTNARHYFLIAYFTKQEAGVNLALSTDGSHWTPLNDGKVVMTPQVEGKLTRDPSIILGHDGIYHMVWTCGWNGKSIGYAESKDLLHWEGQRAIPVSVGVDSSNNTWAPEVFYNERSKEYMIYWSSNVGEWKKMGSEGRIYYVTTKDFATFSAPKILFRNGFPAGGAPGNNGPIDAFIYKDKKDQFILFYKKDDNSHVANLFYRVGKTPEGPWGAEQGPITPSTGDEGPSCVKADGSYMVWTDPWESPYAYLFTSTDLKTWRRTVTDLTMSHGTVIEVSKATALGLLANEPDTSVALHTAPKPLYSDPVYDGAADPVIIWNRQARKYFMYYTNRRANAAGLDGVTWVHGTRIGIAESEDGVIWKYRDTANIRYRPSGECTYWAPDVFEADGVYHMFLTYVPGVFTDWGHPREIIHLTSENLIDWDYVSTAKLVSDRVIDPTLFKMPDGSWRMWYNNETDHKSIYYADSKDLSNWDLKGKAIGDQRGEGPKVFKWKGKYWMLVDNWAGMSLYYSDDLTTWTRQPDRILEKPGKGKDDQAIGGHADVVVSDDHAYVYYFTHPGRASKPFADSYATRRSVIQVAELAYHDGVVTADRDEPLSFELGRMMINSRQ